MKRSISKLLKLVLSGLLIAVSFSNAVLAESGGVGGRPANPDPDNSRTQSIFIYTLKGGESKQDQLYLSNAAKTDEVIQLYAVDGVITNTGAFTCEQAVESRDGVGKWLALTKNEVNIPAGGSLLVDFSLKLPQNVDVGEHDGCIAIQRKNAPSVESGSVRVQTRQAVRVAVIVPGDIHRSVTIEKFAAETNNNGPTLHFSLKNEGNVSADVDTRVPLTDMFGNVVYKNGGQYAVIADTNFDVNYDIDYRPFWGGWYKAKVFIAYDKRAGIFGTNDKAQLLYAESPEVVIFLWPSLWFFVLLGVLLLGTVGAIVWRRGRRQRGKSRAKAAPKQSSTQPMWELYVVKKNETLEQLAKKRGTSVNKVALLNRLTAPYEVAAGQKIYLPKRK